MAVTAEARATHRSPRDDAGALDVRELLGRKRDGQRLEPRELHAFVAGITSGEVGDAQLGAFAMAVRLRGMDAAETRELTLAMRDSGERLDWRSAGLDGPVLDKHSTGGVGDLTSLVLAPMLAACGAYLPMLSGHGLGHTGGTLDKLESIPGISTRLETPRLMRIVRECGLALAAAGPGLAPADARLYAVRDLTATVDSLPLVTASILAKKLAAGSEALVLDVKCGSGATFVDEPAGRALAVALVDTACAAGLPALALLTDMDQPLVPDVGNALEMRLALDYLACRRRPERLHALCLELGMPLLCRGGLATDPGDARQRLLQALDGGDAAERLARMLWLQGGPADALERPEHWLEAAPCRMELCAPRAGHVSAIDARALGMAVVGLGGGRRQPGDRIDPRVGLASVRGLGDAVATGDPLLVVHAADDAAARRACAALSKALTLADEPPTPAPLVRDRHAGPGWVAA